MRPDCCEGLDALGAQRIDNGLPAGQNLADGIWAVADEQHVAAGSVGGRHAGNHVADDARSGHGQIVGENDTFKVYVVSQIIYPFI